MKSFNSRIWILSALFAVLIMAACGGHRHKGDDGGGSGQTASAPQMSITTIKGMHLQPAKITTATTYKMRWDLVPTVEAATTTSVAVGQNWEGACTASPNAGAQVSFLVFGLGQNTSSACTNFFFNDPDGSNAAANATNGKLVYGAGTLSNLVVSTDPGTNIQSDVPITVWVKRSGTVLNTGVTCSIPAGVNELICQSTTPFTLQDLDRMIVVGVVGPNDHITGLNVAFTKAI